MGDTLFTPGHWVLVRGWSDGLLSPDLGTVDRATAKLVKWRWHGGTGYVRQARKEDVIACLPTQEAAERLRDSLNDIRGERDRRISAAREAAQVQAEAIIAKHVGEAA